MTSLNMTVPDVLQFTPSLVLSLWDGFTGSNVLAGDVIVRIDNTEPRFQNGSGGFVFDNLPDGSYSVSIQSVQDEPYYSPAKIPVTLPFPRPADTLWDQPPVWPGYPDIVLADPGKMLDDPEQTPAYLGQRALATLSPTTAYPFPAGTTLVRGTVTAAGVPLNGALVTTAPLAQPGQFPVVVVSPSLATSAAQSLTVVRAPVIYSIDPPVVIAGAASFTITAKGSGFEPGAVLTWNAAPLPTTFLGSSGLAAQVSTAQATTAAQVTMTAVNPDGTVSSPQKLTVAVAPTIISIDPPSVAAGHPAFALSIQGSGFAPAATVELRGVALATTWLSSTQLKAQVVAGQVASAGQVNVVVNNPGSPSQSSNIQIFVVASTPIINSLEPSTVVAGSPAFTLRLGGSGFDSSAVVKLGSAAVPTTFQSANQLTAQITAAQVARAGRLSITVTNPSGGASNTQTLAVVTALAISSLQPVSIAAGTAALALVVRGSGFVSGAVVELNGIALSTIFVNSTELDAHVSRSGYTTGKDGTFVLFFDDVKGLSQVKTFAVTHPGYPKAKSLDVNVVRGSTVSFSIDMSS
jgi:hypothetical protein